MTRDRFLKRWQGWIPPSRRDDFILDIRELATPRLAELTERAAAATDPQIVTPLESPIPDDHEPWSRLRSIVDRIPSKANPETTMVLDAEDLRAILWAKVLFGGGNVKWKVVPRVVELAAPPFGDGKSPESLGVRIPDVGVGFVKIKEEDSRRRHHELMTSVGWELDGRSEENSGLRVYRAPGDSSWSVDVCLNGSWGAYGTGGRIVGQGAEFASLDAFVRSEKFIRRQS